MPAVPSLNHLRWFVCFANRDVEDAVPYEKHHQSCHCEGRRPVAIRTPSLPLRGGGICEANDGEVNAGSAFFEPSPMVRLLRKQGRRGSPGWPLLPFGQFTFTPSPTNALSVMPLRGVTERAFSATHCLPYGFYRLLRRAATWGLSADAL